MTMPFWTPELREYAKLVASVPDIKCCDCPLYTKKKTRQGGWCQDSPMDKKVNVSEHTANDGRPCFHYARLILKMPV